MNCWLRSMFMVTSMLQFASGLAYGSCLFLGEDKGSQVWKGISIGVHAICVAQHFEVHMYLTIATDMNFCNCSNYKTKEG